MWFWIRTRFTQPLSKCVLDMVLSVYHQIPSFGTLCYCATDWFVYICLSKHYADSAISHVTRRRPYIHMRSELDENNRWILHVRNRKRPIPVRLSPIVCVAPHVINLVQMFWLDEYYYAGQTTHRHIGNAHFTRTASHTSCDKHTRHTNTECIYAICMHVVFVRTKAHPNCRHKYIERYARKQTPTLAHIINRAAHLLYPFIDTYLYKESAQCSNQTDCAL